MSHGFLSFYRFCYSEYRSVPQPESRPANRPLRRRLHGHFPRLTSKNVLAFAHPRLPTSKPHPEICALNSLGSRSSKKNATTFTNRTDVAVGEQLNSASMSRPRARLISSLSRDDGASRSRNNRTFHSPLNRANSLQSHVGWAQKTTNNRAGWNDYDVPRTCRVRGHALSDRGSSG